MNYLTKRVIIAANQFAVSLSKDPFVILNEANLDYLISSVQYKYSDKDGEEQLVLKAAFMFDFMANKGHMFAEGNKRTAVSSTLLFLAMNDAALVEIDEGELLNFVLLVASGQQSISSVARWLKQRIKITK
ncbi:MAG: type II toxin-antitoxin system death-on-curing family toxin [Candidatus Micrarchaeota archaeon]